ncbi:MAG: hypothetical protein JWL70_208 [Acidimicrobiia bacterium]|nr:hypothetical protein [Acidimicrobiia bacterium]
MLADGHMDGYAAGAPDRRRSSSMTIEADRAARDRQDHRQRQIDGAERAARAERDVLRRLLPEGQPVTVVDQRGHPVGQLAVAARGLEDVEVVVQRGEFIDGPISVRVGGDGVAWALEGLLIHLRAPFALLANLALVGRVQQRAWARAPFLGPIELFDERDAHWTMDGIDVSAGGLAGWCDEPPPRQAIATFAVETAGVSQLNELSVRVVRARSLPDGRWRVAYRFDRIDPIAHERLVDLVAQLIDGRCSILG